VPNYTTEQILALLRDNPPAMSALTAGLTPDQLKRCTDVDQWSMLDLLAHVQATADGWGAGIGRVLGHAGLIARTPAIEPYLAKRTPATGEYAPAFQDYERQRTRLLRVLTPLTASDWQRTAPRSRTKAERAKTVQLFAQQLVRHEQTHLKQARRIVRALNR
jgi:hypothetical protein